MTARLCELHSLVTFGSAAAQFKALDVVPGHGATCRSYTGLLQDTTLSGLLDSVPGRSTNLKQLSPDLQGVSLVE